MGRNTKPPQHMVAMDKFPSGDTTPRIPRRTAQEHPDDSSLDYNLLEFMKLDNLFTESSSKIRLQKDTEKSSSQLP